MQHGVSKQLHSLGKGPSFKFCDASACDACLFFLRHKNVKHKEYDSPPEVQLAPGRATGQGKPVQNIAAKLADPLQRSAAHHALCWLPLDHTLH